MKNHAGDMTNTIITPVCKDLIGENVCSLAPNLLCMYMHIKVVAVFLLKSLRYNHSQQSQGNKQQREDRRR